MDASEIVEIENWNIADNNLLMDNINLIS